MRASFTAVIEQNTTFAEDFVTEPYETAWASEARWFVHARTFEEAGVTLRLYPEISPDGLIWCDEGTAPLVISKEGMVSFALREFGHWLRLRGEFSDAQGAARLRILLALKE